MTATDHHRGTSTLQHDAFVYDSDEEYLSTLAPLIHHAQAAGDAVVAVVPGRNARLLGSMLGEGGEPVQVLDAATWYSKPVTTIGAYDDFLRALPDGRRAFVIGEVVFGDTEADWLDWTRYEAALNRALHHHNARVICPYDSRVLAPSVIDDARRTHPYLVTATGTTHNPHYCDPAELVPALPPAVTVPPEDPDLDLTGVEDLASARQAFATLAADHGLDRGRLDELTLALNEVLTNAMLHGRGPVRLRIWSRSRPDLVCVVDDAGPGVDDPLVGYTRPPEGALGGYGAWFARRLFDRCEFMAGDGGGLTVVLSARR